MKAETGKFRTTMEEYNSYPAVRGSNLVTLINESPAHYLYELENPKPATESMERGTRVHTAALEPKIFKERMIVRPVFEGYTTKGELTTSMNCKEVKDKHQKWEMQNHNKMWLTQEQYDQVGGILTSLSKHKRAVQLMSDGHAEESFIWKDPETGLWLKSRPDYYREGHICVQLKTCDNAKTEAFMKDVLNRGYHIRAAMELEALTAVFSRPFDEYIFIAVEESAPYAVNTIKLGERSLQEGQELFYKGLRTLKKCQDSGVWPAYGDDIVYADIPEYGFKGEI
jgi:exodeoxyribonuclease VIII